MWNFLRIKRTVSVCLSVCHTVTVWNYQTAACSVKKNNYLKQNRLYVMIRCPPISLSHRLTAAPQQRRSIDSCRRCIPAVYRYLLPAPQLCSRQRERNAVIWKEGRQRVRTAGIVCGAGSMQWYGVRLSVCPSTGSQQQTRCCMFAAMGPARRTYRSIAGERAAAAAGDSSSCQAFV